MALYLRKNENDTKQVIAIYKGAPDGYKVVSAVYLGAKLLWQYVKSCYGRGYWMNEKPWSVSDAWIN